MPLRKSAKEIREILDVAARYEKESGSACYMVGGSVRRMLLDKKIYDLDIVVDGTGGAEELANEISSSFKGASKPQSINNFSTVEVRTKDIIVQISESEENPKVNYQSIYAPISDRMKADALRRDFTVNTLLIPVSDPKPDTIIDPLSIGIQDLNKKVLRTPLDAAQTFKNDPIRMLRTIRFCVSEGFEASDEIPGTIQKLSHLIAKEPGERINIEFSKIITSEFPSDGIGQMIGYGLLRHIFPDVEQLATIDQTTEYYDDNVLNHTLKVLDNSGPILRLRLAVLFHDIGKAQTRQVKGGKVVFHGHQYAGAELTRKELLKLRYPNKLIDEVTKLVEKHMIAYRPEWSDMAVRRLAHDAGELIDDLLLLYRADILARSRPHNDLTLFEHLMERIKMLDLEAIIHARSPLAGEEVMSILNLDEGPAIGEAQSAIEQAIVDGRIRSTARDAKSFLINDYMPRIKGKQ